MEAIEEQGLWPFVSRRIYRHYNGTHHAWQSRHHRKGLSMFEPLELLLSHLLGVETAKSVVVDHIHESPRLRRLHDLCLLRLRTEGGIPLQRRTDFRLLYALGAVGFLAGSLLMLPEASDAASHGSSSAA